MSDKRKVLITADSTIAAGRFVDRGDVVEVAPQVAQDLLNERKATANEKAIAARESEIAAARPKTEKAAVKPKTEKAAKVSDEAPPAQ
jgi:topoisomerase IA-like protein